MVLLLSSACFLDFSFCVLVIAAPTVARSMNMNLNFVRQNPSNPVVVSGTDSCSPIDRMWRDLSADWRGLVLAVMMSVCVCVTEETELAEQTVLGRLRVCVCVCVC